uniref:Uncharacterized protein n=1 Tax=Octopus bimaculoides TaxID=37653 RepID=A0A0L8GWX8_OCTBM
MVVVLMLSIYHVQVSPCWFIYIEIHGRRKSLQLSMYPILYLIYRLSLYFYRKQCHTDVWNV